MIDRRTFIKSSSALVAGMAMPHIVKSAEFTSAAAGDTLNVALIGCKGMGWYDLSDMLLHKDVKCLALCDIDRNILNARAGELEKKYGTKPDTYGDYRKALDRKDIDLVIIGTPDHWHCLPMVDACNAGKDVYVEKPIANSIAECDVMVAAAKKYNRIVQVGQQQRSGKHWHEMVEYLRSGALGKIGRVNVWANFSYAGMPPAVPDSPVPEGVDFETWLGPSPKLPFNSQRFHGSWRMFWNYGGGLLTDWGVHLLDMGLWGMDIKGMPLKVTASGGKFLFPNGAHETFDTLSVIYQFKDFIYTWENNTVETGPYGRNYGVSFRGTNGTLVADRDNWEVIPEGNKAEAIKKYSDGADHRDHLTNFLECVKTRNPNTACTIENGAFCATYAQLGNISARMGGEALIYDDKAKKFNISAANKYLKPAYRSPWKFPEV
ncbi:MAG: Gfo/Idh/MocA family oxidoreductase [Bacteroidales bacterium]|jgi:predicted dehydrogenase|nr:Gfo/Idh/MocA family oxidoreductase [Bacteroidales bacterium]